ncbi:hypothetical protein [Litchfieldia salsa]|uniref:Uncharacterized protein n=1 Tax=Litchfieldia salsa TaxID=930152 RepID=A0A1H0TEA2_9BACI|nr:hypothetical protein [Litchfieldia salsa]SDP52334.1 hypothetical protein SAMN05216565_103464 [Litchfieldia salsa]
MDENKKEPRFKVGDIVVITQYGTVGTVTDIEKVDNHYFYKVNHGQHFYLESSLNSISTYQGGEIEIEQLEVQFQYYFGDLVFVKGYGEAIFKIVGIRTEIWRYKEGSFEEIVYELSRLSDGEWLEASEEELILIADSENAEIFLQKLTLYYLIKKEKKSMELHAIMDMSKKTEKEIIKLQKEKEEIVDGLLDVYNDYKYLYEVFGDDKYKKVMDLALKNLDKYIQNHYSLDGNKE